MSCGKRRLAALAIAAAAASIPATGCFANRFRDSARIAVVDGDPIVALLPASDFPSVEKARMVPFSGYRVRPNPADRVLGISAFGGARAYPLGLLDRFEVVNDEAGGQPFVVVRCALTEVAAAWERRVGERVLVFEGTGALWRDTLVLRDRDTGTYWSAATGVAISGPLAGEKLRGVPAVVTRGDRWRRVHPHSLYLDTGAATSAPVKLRIYRMSPMQGVSGQKTSDRRHRPKEEMLAIAAGPEALAFTRREIESLESIDTSLAGEPVRIVWEPALGVPRATSRDGRERPVLPMYWFALDRHFERVMTLGGPKSGVPKSSVEPPKTKD